MDELRDKNKQGISRFIPDDPQSPFTIFAAGVGVAEAQAIAFAAMDELAALWCLHPQELKILAKRARRN